jgi:hypothetical protein
MIIHDFYVISITIDPLKAYPLLVIDTDTILPCPVVAKFLQSVCWWNTKIFKGDGIVEHTQLAVADLLDVLGQPGRSQAGKYTGSLLVLEGFDHVC